MRLVLLLPLTVLAVVSGCGSPREEEVAVSKPERDLALPAQAPRVEIASPVELGRVQLQPAANPSRRIHGRSRPSVPTIIPAVVEPVAAAAPVVSKPAGYTAPAAAGPVNDRELPPGKTVTIIPASSGPSIESDGVDELPPFRGPPSVRRGGTCRGRGPGPGIGIAAVPAPSLR